MELQCLQCVHVHIALYYSFNHHRPSYIRHHTSQELDYENHHS
jgi:hypothetical protein